MFHNLDMSPKPGYGGVYPAHPGDGRPLLVASRAGPGGPCGPGACPWGCARTWACTCATSSATNRKGPQGYRRCFYTSGFGSGPHPTKLRWHFKAIWHFKAAIFADKRRSKVRIADMHVLFDGSNQPRGSASGRTEVRGLSRWRHNYPIGLNVMVFTAV